MRTVRLRRPGDDLELEAALRDAFAPLRARRATVSPLRVRAGVRWGRGASPAALPWTSAVSRLSELSVAVGMSVMVFIAAFGVPPAPAVDTTVDEAKDVAVYAVPHVSAPADDASYIRWLRLDRYVPLQDWLDPSVVRISPVAPRRLDPPAPTAADEPY
ncbi:MAG: hypothetical protein KGN00_01515 [Chloroflexota bacterium]|nr:hypothetical protein [Chloroflexota bacterium]MDE3192341.1 hypothetical protein [Chloroflexota bacterium]